jgi:hypothetical protein
MVQTIVAILASIVGIISSLGMLILLMAGLANAKPAQLQQGKMMMWGIVLVQVVALVAAVWLMVKHKPWLASATGIAPFVVVVVLIVILVKIEW